MTAILFLHGGGHADHTRYAKLINLFANHNIIGLAFDHQANTLIGRLAEAEQQLSNLKTQYNLTDENIYVWGSSMGGHVAVMLTQQHPNLKGLILQSAAAYSLAAESIPFGSGFTKKITQKGSYLNSPAFNQISTYKQSVLVIYGENDDVIPQAVKDKYIARAIHNGEYYVLAGVGHTLLRPHNDKQLAAWNMMSNHALHFVEKSKKNTN